MLSLRRDRRVVTKSSSFVNVVVVFAGLLALTACGDDSETSSISLAPTTPTVAAAEPTTGQTSPNTEAGSGTSFAADMKEAADSTLAGGCYSNCEFAVDLCAELIPNGESLRASASSTQGIPTQVYCAGKAGGVWMDVDLLYASLPSIIDPGTGGNAVFANVDSDGSTGESVALASMEADGCSTSEVEVGGTRFGCSAADGVNVFAMSDSEYAAQVAVVGPEVTVVVRVTEGDAASILDVLSHVRSLMGFAPAVDEAVASAIG